MFKVGDKVTCINPNSWLVQGYEYIITNSGKDFVTLKGIMQEHFARRFELIKEEPMEKCLFEIGKTYKTRDGREAKVVDVDLGASTDTVLIARIEGTVRTYYSSGRCLAGIKGGHQLDLMPPVPPLTLKLGGKYRRADGAEVLVTIVHDTRAEANGLAYSLDGISISDMSDRQLIEEII